MQQLDWTHLSRSKCRPSQTNLSGKLTRRCALWISPRMDESLEVQPLTSLTSTVCLKIRLHTDHSIWKAAVKDSMLFLCAAMMTSSLKNNLLLNLSKSLVVLPDCRKKYPEDQRSLQDSYRFVRAAEGCHLWEGGDWQSMHELGMDNQGKWDCWVWQDSEWQHESLTREVLIL